MNIEDFLYDNNGMPLEPGVGLLIPPFKVEQDRLFSLLLSHSATGRTYIPGIMELTIIKEDNPSKSKKITIKQLSKYTESAAYIPVGEVPLN